jgi:Bacterial dnaA protein helix-turn-helix
MNCPIRDVQTAVAARFGLRPEQMLGLNRARIVSHPRQIAMFLAREMTGLSLPRIGRHFARDHTTILHAVRRIKTAMAADPGIAAQVEGCRELLAQISPPSVRHAGKPASARSVGLAANLTPTSAALPHGGRKPVEDA